MVLFLVSPVLFYYINSSVAQSKNQIYSSVAQSKNQIYPSIAESSNISNLSFDYTTWDEDASGHDDPTIWVNSRYMQN